MAAKLLHSLADENPDLQKQIGCMTGIFQLFDRHQIVTPRRISHKRLPPGNSHSNYESMRRDSNSIHQPQTAADMNLNKGVSEKQRISTESSRASFSSSCSSSISSMDCKAQADASFDRITFPETPRRDQVMNQTSTSTNLGHQSLDLRDVVKDSMYREARGLSVKTTIKEEVSIGASKQKDSPRPLHLSISDYEYDRVGIDGEQSVPIDLKESIRVLSKLTEAPWHYDEGREVRRLPYEVKDAQWHSISKDARRFSYDAREVHRYSSESQDTIKSTPRLKELPRLSLDSREVSWRTYTSDSKSNHLLRNFSSGTSDSDDKVSSLQQRPSAASQSRPPSVVAKLMGLEALPASNLASETHSILSETDSTQGDDQFSRSSKNGLIRPFKVSNSSKSSMKDPSSPSRKNPDLVVKPISSSRHPIEPAPWKRRDRNQSSPRPSSAAMKATSITDSFPSVYSEVEKRLKNLEFDQSGRDLRALKQILEAMQAKGLLETRQEEQVSNLVGNQRDHEPKPVSLTQNSRTARKQSPHRNNIASSTFGGSDSARSFESPIVIMKPAKHIEKNGISSSSVIPLVELSDSHKLQSVRMKVRTGNGKGTGSGRITKDQSPRNNHREASTSFSEKKASSKTIRSTQSQPRSQQFTKENSPSSVKNSGSVSPRLQQKKLELEKCSRPPTPPSESSKPRRQSGKQTTESGSPGRKPRHKVPISQQSDDQLSEISNESRSLSFQGDETSLQSGSTITESKMDVELASNLQSAETVESQSPSLKTIEHVVSGTIQKKSTLMLDENEPISELAMDAPDHPSPVSVLDGSVYREDVLSPVKLISNAPKGDVQSKEDDYEYQWNTADDSLSVNSEINRKKLQSIDHLVQKLRRLNSSHDEARIDYIGSLCENSNPDHRYISEILLASGLLLRDLSSELLTFQRHSSGHPINPELFLVLEQTKASSFLAKEEIGIEKVDYKKTNTDKSHRRFIFNAVNEILGMKLASSPEPWLKPNGLAKKNLSAQKLLKELCFEIEKIQVKKPECTEDEGDGIKSILCENVTNGTESWTIFHGETSGVVLDVERLIFKDLIDEIVIGEATGLRIKPGRRRKLFGK
ncbi:protein LONGIFOLIA 2 [Arachis stenosperma]|uniref:protein LONGIFOLIA 2 n=1 Tax=Arachis stenosperma TaxID=217475 RepID=UPI0025AD2585|nr:protein LONGIFOLIA 2 [Arachis stenosperma]